MDQAIRIPILDCVDLFDPRIMPKTAAKTGTVTRYDPICPKPAPDKLKHKPSAHYVTGEMGHWGSGLHTWDYGRTSGKGWNDKDSWICESCKLRYVDIVTDTVVPYTTRAKTRGAITNVEFAALFLLQRGPTVGKELLLAMGKWRGKDGPLGGGAAYISPDNFNMNYEDAKGVRYCGADANAQCYWWREPCGRGKGSSSRLILSSFGFYFATTQALPKALKALGIAFDPTQIDEEEAA